MTDRLGPSSAPTLVRDSTGQRVVAASLSEKLRRLVTTEVGTLAATPHDGAELRVHPAVDNATGAGGGSGIFLLPPIIGPAEARSSDFAQCARLSSNSGLQRVAGNVDDRAPDNANAQMLQTAELSRGISGLHAEIWQGDPMLLAQQHIPLGRYLTVGVNCTPNCVPVTYNSGIRHWLELYSTLGDCYNCWFAQLVRYLNLSQCHNYLMGTVVTWRDGAVPLANPQDAPPAVAITRVEENRMEFNWSGYRYIIYIGGDGRLRRARQSLNGGGWDSKVIDTKNVYAAIVGGTYDTMIHVSALRKDSALMNIYSGDGVTFGAEGPIPDNSR